MSKRKPFSEQPVCIECGSPALRAMRAGDVDVPLCEAHYTHAKATQVRAASGHYEGDWKVERVGDEEWKISQYSGGHWHELQVVRDIRIFEEWIRRKVFKVQALLGDGVTGYWRQLSRSEAALLGNAEAIREALLESSEAGREDECVCCGRVRSLYIYSDVNVRENIPIEEQLCKECFEYWMAHPTRCLHESVDDDLEVLLWR